MIDIDNLKADREAGTPGPWVLEYPDATWGIVPGSKRGYIFMSCFFEKGDGHDVRNARRIARVPDLETAVIAAEALADAVTGYSDQSTMPDQIGEALAAYREVTK